MKATVAGIPIEIVSGQECEKAEETSVTNRPGGGGTRGGGAGDTEKPLEYQLIDLLRAEGITETESKAIWTLVQFLAGRREKAKTISKESGTSTEDC